MSGPLTGLKVLDFTHVLAGPFATRVLGDMGADVVKVLSEDRALAANHPSYPYYLMWNRNKRALSLNMREPGARAICRELCEHADIVIDNFSVGVLDRWGVGFEAVSETNFRVIYVQMSGMGEGGPWSRFVTYAPTIHALCGLTQMTGVPGREDIGIGFSYNDHQAGLHGAVAVLAALEARERTGHGERVDISQFEVGANFAALALLDLFANGNAARPCANDLPFDAAAPHGCYRCQPHDAASTMEERWIAIACLTDAHWQALRQVMGDPEWAGDPRFDTGDGRFEARALLDRKLSEFTRDQEAYALMQRCQSAGVPTGVVQDGVDLAERDPQLADAGFLQPITDVHPELGQTWADRLPLRFHRTPCESYRRVRNLGEDNAEVLEDWLGMSEADVRAAEQDGRLR